MRLRLAVAVCVLLSSASGAPSLAATIRVTGVVVRDTDGTRVGGARIGLYYVGAESFGPSAEGRTSEEGLYGLELPNVVGTAPLELWVTYYPSSESKKLVVEPQRIPVDPRMGDVMQMSGDLRLLDTESPAYSGPEAVIRLEAIAVTTEVLSRDPNATSEVATLQSAAAMVGERVQAPDDRTRFELDQLVGRTELAGRVAGGATAADLAPLMERYHLAGRLSSVEGELSTAARITLEGSARVLDAHPDLTLEVVAADAENAARIEDQLVRLGVDRARVEVKTGGGGGGADTMGRLRVVAARVE